MLSVRLQLQKEWQFEETLAACSFKEGNLEENIREIRWNSHERVRWYYQDLNQLYINKKHSLYWLKKGKLDSSAKRVIITGQNNKSVVKCL